MLQNGFGELLFPGGCSKTVWAELLFPGGYSKTVLASFFFQGDAPKRFWRASFSGGMLQNGLDGVFFSPVCSQTNGKLSHSVYDKSKNKRIAKFSLRVIH
jgi:hypothetical protein